MNTDLFHTVDLYIASLLAEENADLQKATQHVKTNELPDQSISPVQGKLLQVLATASKATRILEVGTFGAYSTLWLAGILPSDGKLITLEYDDRHAEIALQTIQQSSRKDYIELRKGRALDLLQDMIHENEPAFDFIFIDADKPPYLEYFQLALKLARKGTIIVCDNVIRNGRVLDIHSEDEKVIGVQRLNQFLKNCKEVTATIIQTVGVKEYDGMVLAVVL